MKIYLFIAILLLAGCVTPPQTVREFREGFQQGGTFTKIEKKNIQRPFSDVFQNVKTNADKCFNIGVSGSTPGSAVPHKEYTRYRSHSTKTGKAFAETVLQMEKNASGKMPEGGYYAMLTDMEGLTGTSTRVTVYAPSIGYDEVFQAIFEWANGKDRACPNWMR